ncbi:SLATT domain-containing protein [Streptomyces sp. NPDC056486]|uniref:SLATT domain-containing protein n=1 Tax=Streptomyces sp. NPDC056486 TaxID=3345835 RepID=UPI0036AF2F2F
MLHERVEQLREAAAHLLPYTVGIEPAARTLPAVTDVPSYTEFRLKQQIRTYYTPKARQMSRRVTAVRAAELTLGATGALLGALAGAFGVDQAAAWVAVAGAATIAVGAHGLAARYAYQQTEFAVTADTLRRALERWLLVDGPGAENDDAFVAHCEHVISVLNDSWMVQWTAE